jgi:hypothetical protein
MQQQGGFIQLIIIIALLLIILSLLGVSLRSVFSDSLLQDNFGVVGKWISDVWVNYLETPATFLFDLFVEKVWDPIFNTTEVTETTE